MKVECDGCGKQVPHEELHLNGWWIIQQHIVIMSVEQREGVSGNFCTASCIVRFLETKGLVVKESELK